MACPCGEAGGLADSVAPLESREFQAGPLLLPVPTQVPQLATRAASLLEHHAIQLCQGVKVIHFQAATPAPRLPQEALPAHGHQPWAAAPG